MDYKEIAKHLQKNIQGLHFGVELTCQYGDSYTESVRGKKFKFVMWRNVIITETNVLSICGGKLNDYEEEVIRKIFKLLRVKFFHVGTDEFDNVREFYEIEGLITKEFYEDLLNKIEAIEIVPRERYTPVILISDTKYDIYDWYFDADPENGLDIDRENYEIKYGELE